MCGIAGYYLPTDLARRRSKRPDVADLPAVLKHRGPDSHGAWYSDRQDIYFFHSRLAIQDLSPLGHQPMISRCGRFCITFNGEIYNFNDLSVHLKSAGATLRGHSDTEVLIEYISRFGIEKALDDIEGMFAFALYDRVLEKLYLVRDRIGEKPLYWFFEEGVLAFASEIKGLRVMFGPLGDIDPVSLGQYFRYGYVPDPRSIYKKVRKLAPGCMLEIPVGHGGNTSRQSIEEFEARHVRQYWSLVDVRANSLANPFQDRTEAVREIHQSLKRIVSNQSIADVDVGVYLSGGIDSTLMAAILQDESSAPVNSFTVGFDDPAFNEAPFARALANHFGTNHHELVVTELDLLSMVERLPHVYDEPLANASQIPVMLLAGYASQHVKVCISGDGGDELFGGYNRYLWGARFSRLNRNYPQWLRRPVAQALSLFSGLNASSHLVRPLLGRGPIQNLDAKFAKASTGLGFETEEGLYDFLLSTWNSANPAFGNGNDFRLRHDAFGRDDFIDAAMLSDQLHYLPGDNLQKVDRASMAVSLEVRLPLLSHVLLSQAWRVPASMRMEGGESKSILRDILYQYAPRHLIDRPKMGFSVPLGQWLRGPLRDWAGSLVESTRTQDLVGLNRQVLAAAWSDHLCCKADRSSELWSVLVFLQWCEEAIA
jgi:asparagine synthase (glutamine-hydrolysing)